MTRLLFSEFCNTSSRMLVLALSLLAASNSYSDLLIYHIDVNQADSTLFVGPTGKALLIDTGENGSGDEICQAAQFAGVSKIDVLITTHHHRDHHGGVDELADCGLSIDQAFDRGHKPDREDMGTHLGNYQDTVAQVVQVASAGDVIAFDTDVTVTVVASNGLLEGEVGDPTEDENDASVAVLIEYKGFSGFYGGDMELATENKIVQDKTVENVSLYQANHHGADNGSSRAFLDLLKPKVIIISNGNHAGHAHPRASTLKRMKETIPAPVIFQTNKFTKTGCNRCSLAGNTSDDGIADLEPSGSTLPIVVKVDGQGEFTVTFYREHLSGPF